MIEKAVTLACSRERAFALFTRHISEWWPIGRRHTGDPESELFLLQSGRFFERAKGGREVELGLVRFWEPPARLLLDFYPGTDPEHPTEVEVLFEEVDSDPARTRVTVLHRATAASADLFDLRAPRYAASWDLAQVALSRAAARLQVGN